MHYKKTIRRVLINLDYSFTSKTNLFANKCKSYFPRQFSIYFAILFGLSFFILDLLDMVRLWVGGGPPLVARPPYRVRGALAAGMVGSQAFPGLFGRDPD